MDKVLVVVAFLCFWYLIYTVSSIESVLQEILKHLRSESKASEAHTVAMMVATMASGMLSNPKQREELQAAIANDRTVRSYTESERSALGKEVDFESLQYMDDDANRAVQALDVFSYDMQQGLVKSAWSTYQEIKKTSPK